MNRSVYMPLKALRPLRHAALFLFHPDIQASYVACDTVYWFLSGQKPVRGVINDLVQ